MIRKHKDIVKKQKLKKYLQHTCYGFYKYYIKRHNIKPLEYTLTLQEIASLPDNEEYVPCDIMNDLVKQEAVMIVKELSKADKLKIIKGEQ